LRERVGPAGEAAARAHLEGLGYRVLEQDWRCAIGQADLIAADGETLVLVEVKARRGAAFGLPQEAVDWRKQRKLISLLEAYRQSARATDRPCRIDVLALLLDGDLSVRRCEHIISAVEG
jgi:putative endonuclease